MKTRREKVMMAILIIIVILLGVRCALADDRDRRERDTRTHNWILERQSAYMVEGPPTDRILVGKREIDGYRQRDGTRVWYERDHVVGVTR